MQPHCSDEVPMPEQGNTALLGIISSLLEIISSLLRTISSLLEIISSLLGIIFFHFRDCFFPFRDHFFLSSPTGTSQPGDLAEKHLFHLTVPQGAPQAPATPSAALTAWKPVQDTWPVLQINQSLFLSSIAGKHMDAWCFWLMMVRPNAPSGVRGGGGQIMLFLNQVIFPFCT